MRSSPSMATSICPGFNSPDLSAGPTTSCSALASCVLVAPSPPHPSPPPRLMSLFLRLKPTTTGPAYSFLSSILMPSHLPSKVISTNLFVPFIWIYMYAVHVSFEVVTATDRTAEQVRREGGSEVALRAEGVKGDNREVFG